MKIHPFIELAIERWARERNNQYDRELSNWNRKRLWHTHPHLFHGNRLKPTEKQIRARVLATQEGGTREVLEARATRARVSALLQGVISTVRGVEDMIMEPFVKLAIERWAREYNNQYDQKLIDWKRNFQGIGSEHSERNTKEELGRRAAKRATDTLAAFNVE
jgi:hypothetical protein